MIILVSYISALEYWRTVGSRFLQISRKRQSATRAARNAFADARKPQLEGGGRRPAGCALPLHVLVPHANLRTETHHVVSHTWSTPLPDACFIDGGAGFLVSSPEFCFLQLASRLTVAGLIKLGFELCGTYVHHEGAPATNRREPLTTVAKLTAFVEKAEGARGRTKAKRALRYVLDGSASPMETALVMLLCLPYNMGGYGLERPLLNHRVDIPERLRKASNKSYCECDLYWPRANLCVEYDSNAWHADVEKIDRDAKRRNTLVTLGVTVATVTSAQLNGEGINKLARLLAKQTGKRLCYRDPEFTQKHFKLREEIFGSAGEL